MLQFNKVDCTLSISKKAMESKSKSAGKPFNLKNYWMGADALLVSGCVSILAKKLGELH